MMGVWGYGGTEDTFEVCTYRDIFEVDMGVAGMYV